MSIRCSGFGQAQLHHRQQAVAAGDDARARSRAAASDGDRAVDAGRALVLKRRWGLHQRAPLLSRARRTAVAGRPCAGPPCLGRLVLDRRVGADDRRARQLAGRVCRTRGRAARAARLPYAGVAQRRAVRAGGGDRRLAAEPGERQRPPRVDLGDPRRLDRPCSRGSCAGRPRPRRGTARRPGRPRRPCPAFLTSRPSSRSTPGVEVRVDRRRRRRSTGALFSMIPTTPAIASSRPAVILRSATIVDTR